MIPHTQRQENIICLDSMETYIGEKKIFSYYESNLMPQDGVERNLISTGEAMNLLLKKQPEIAIIKARRIVDFRNRLTHG